MIKLLGLLFGWLIKTFQYFFPPHKEIQARYVALFALTCVGWVGFGMTFGYLYFRIWHNPNVPFSQYANQPTPSPVVDHSYPLTRNPNEDDKVLKTGPRTHKTGTLAHTVHP